MALDYNKIAEDVKKSFSEDLKRANKQGTTPKKK